MRIRRFTSRPGASIIGRALVLMLAAVHSDCAFACKIEQPARMAAPQQTRYHHIGIKDEARLRLLRARHQLRPGFLPWSSVENSHRPVHPSSRTVHRPLCAALLPRSKLLDRLRREQSACCASLASLSGRESLISVVMMMAPKWTCSDNSGRPGTEAIGPTLARIGLTRTLAVVQLTLSGLPRFATCVPTRVPSGGRAAGIGAIRPCALLA